MGGEMHKAILAQLGSGCRLPVRAKVCSFQVLPLRRGSKNTFGFKPREGQPRNSNLILVGTVGLGVRFELERPQQGPRIDQQIETHLASSPTGSSLADL